MVYGSRQKANGNGHIYCLCLLGCRIWVVGWGEELAAVGSRDLEMSHILFSSPHGVSDFVQEGAPSSPILDPIPLIAPLAPPRATAATRESLQLLF
jgi:hypothetical protein